MNQLFVGMLLVFLDVTFSFGEHIFDVLPDFVGYLLMMRGLESLSTESCFFEKARPVAMGMMIYCAVLFVVDLLAVTVQAQFVSFCLGILATVGSLLLGYWVVSGVQDIEQQRAWELEGEKLRSMWLYMSVIEVITYVCGWIPLVGQMGVIAAVVMNICYLVAFYRSKNLYEAKK